jgi:UDP-sugar pyrophosphorylase
MQDVPKLVSNGETVGYTYFDRWFCFSACKNNIHDSCERLRKNESGESAFTVEREIFKYNEIILKDILDKLEVIHNEPENEVTIEDCKIKFGPKIIIYPSFAISVSELRDKLSHMKGKIKMTNNSTLILKNHITLDKDIDLDGFLLIDKDQTEPIICKNNKKIIYRLLKEGEGEDYEKIRGYTIEK